MKSLTAGHKATPVICVAPVRSHCSPIRIVFCAAAAAAVPARPAAASASSETRLRLTRFMVRISPSLAAPQCAIAAPAATPNLCRDRHCLPRRPDDPGRRDAGPRTALFRGQLLGGLLGGGDDQLAIGAEPWRLRDKAVALDLEDPHPAAALVI